MTALVISLVALSIDAMLPALPNIGTDLHVNDPNDAQFIISVLLIAMGLGTLLFGPLSDSIGRKKTIYIGFGVFIAGCVASITATTFEAMMLGRMLQGFGCAAPRVAMIAIVRDQYAGNAMARIMSFVMSVFLLVPALAPALGQGIMALTSWRGIFVWLLIMATVAVTWVGLRQPETHPPGKRIPFLPGQLVRAAREVFSHRIAVGYTVATGLIFAPFIGFLSSCQQVFAEVYGEGDRFPFYFAALALSMGAASVLNGKLVLRLGMRRLVRRALVAACVLSLLFSFTTLALNGAPSLPLLMAYFMAAFFCNGMIFSNLNALAMEPLGRVAGMGAAIVNASSTLISVPLGALVGQAFNGTVTPLAISFAGFTALCALATMVTERGIVSLKR
ncbi:MAG: multidrug effflux MFS transporter [Chromatiales bacterium]|nr:multidrug effflux MFS transporter [Chromatiales bacterium]